MSDARELLEQEAKSKCFLEKPGGDAFMGTTEQFAPRAFNALREVLDLHRPMTWYAECDCPGKWDDDTGEHFYVGDEDFLTCERERTGDRCAECTPDGCDEDMVHSVVYPCDTVQRISTALAGEPNG